MGQTIATQLSVTLTLTGTREDSLTFPIQRVGCSNTFRLLKYQEAFLTLWHSQKDGLKKLGFFIELNLTPDEQPTAVLLDGNYGHIRWTPQNVNVAESACIWTTRSVDINQER